MNGWIAVLIILLIWSAIWKGIALWKAGRNNQFGWYVAMFIINTLGILEIVYLYFFQKKGVAAKNASAPIAKKAPVLVKKAKRRK